MVVDNLTCVTISNGLSAEIDKSLQTSRTSYQYSRGGLIGSSSIPLINIQFYKIVERVCQRPSHFSILNSDSVEMTSSSSNCDHMFAWTGHESRNSGLFMISFLHDS